MKALLLAKPLLLSHREYFEDAIINFDLVNYLYQLSSIALRFIDLGESQKSTAGNSLVFMIDFVKDILKSQELKNSPFRAAFNELVLSCFDYIAGTKITNRGANRGAGIESRAELLALIGLYFHYEHREFMFLELRPLIQQHPSLTSENKKLISSILNQLVIIWEQEVDKGIYSLAQTIQPRQNSTSSQSSSQISSQGDSTDVSSQGDSQPESTPSKRSGLLSVLKRLKKSSRPRLDSIDDEIQRYNDFCPEIFCEWIERNYDDHQNMLR